eukprot:g70157.t1
MFDDYVAVLNRPGDVWQEISEYRLVKGRISLRKANDLNSFDLELLNSETLMGALLRDVGNRCAQEIISLQELAKKTGRETFDTLAKKCGWEFTHEQILNFDLAKLVHPPHIQATYICYFMPFVLLTYSFRHFTKQLYLCAKLPYLSDTLPLHVTLSNLHVRAPLRLVLSPLVPRWPCFSRLQVGLTAAPGPSHSLSKN